MHPMCAGQAGGAKTRHTDVIAPTGPNTITYVVLSCLGSSPPSPMGENSPQGPPDSYTLPKDHQLPVFKPWDTPWARPLLDTSSATSRALGTALVALATCHRGPHPLAVLSSPRRSPGAGTDPPSAPLQHCDMRASRPFSLELPVCYSKRGIWLERGGRSGGWRQDGLPRQCGPVALLAPALRPAPRGSRSPDKAQTPAPSPPGDKALLSALISRLELPPPHQAPGEGQSCGRGWG